MKELKLKFRIQNKNPGMCFPEMRRGRIVCAVCFYQTELAFLPITWVGSVRTPRHEAVQPHSRSTFMPCLSATQPSLKSVCNNWHVLMALLISSVTVFEPLSSGSSLIGIVAGEAARILPINNPLAKVDNR